MCSNTGVDIENNIVWANVTHLTIFAPMAEKVKEEAPMPTPLIWLIYAVGIIAIIIICSAIVFARKKKRQ